MFSWYYTHSDMCSVLYVLKKLILSRKERKEIIIIQNDKKMVKIQVLKLYLLKVFFIRVTI